MPKTKTDFRRSVEFKNSKPAIIRSMATTFVDERGCRIPEALVYILEDANGNQIHTVVHDVSEFIFSFLRFHKERGVD